MKTIASKLKRAFLFGILSSFFYYAYSQELPQYTLPSPTAYELGKYGDVPVNESTGIANLGVPLFNLSAGKLGTSVNLSYSTSGIKVNQVASWVGMGWNLNTGGVITRTVRGYADEDAYSRSFETYGNVLAMKNDSDPTDFIDFVKSVNNDLDDDYQPDVFNFSFAGYSGSFYLDSNFNPVVIKHDSEIKIEINGTGLKEFLITTPNGIEYYFGSQSEAGVEFSKAITYNGQQHGDPALNLPTAWYITEIIHPNGDEIYFDYDYNSNYTLTTGFDQVYTKVLYATKMANCADISEGLVTTSYGNILETLKISKISSNRNDETINFHASKSRSDLSDEFKLDSISLKKGTTTLKSYAFDYEFITSTGAYYGASGVPWLNYTEHFKRMYLNKVYEKDNQGNAVNGKEYSFEYEDRVGLPPRMSFSQDLLGFYNGEANNSFLPDNIDVPVNTYFSAVQRGDRSSNFYYAKKGVLTKIIYPTKGYTEIEYEPAIELETTSYNNLTAFSMDVNNTGTTTVHTQDFTSPYNQVIKIYPDLTVLNGGLDYIHDRARIMFKNKSTNDTIFDDVIDKNFASHFEVALLPSVTYEVTISFDVYGFVIEDDVRTTLDFDYISSLSTSSSPENKTGIRVKKIKNKANATAQEEITRYYYASKDDLNSSSFKELKVFNFIESANTLIWGPNCSGNPWDLFHIYTMSKLKSSSLTSFGRLVSEQILYDTVVVSNGDDFQGGGVEKHFKVTLEPPNTTIHGEPIYNSTRSNIHSIENGTLTKEISFKRKNGVVTNVAQKRYVYDTDISKSSYVDAYTNNFRYSTQLVDPMDEIEGIDIGHYELHNKWISLDSVITSQYFGNDSIVAMQKYKYELGLAGLPTEIVSKDSRGKIITTKNYYPDDVITNSSLGFNTLSSNELTAINTLKTQYRIGEILQTESYRDLDNNQVADSDEILSVQRTNYKDWGNNIISPKNISVFKGDFTTSNTLKERVEFHLYDDKGNVLEISKSDGFHIVYIYGYNKAFPIAKIENTTVVELATALSTLDTGYNSLVKLQTLSDADDDRTIDLTGNEGALRNALADLRTALPNTMMTSFTYDPLIGITSVTNPRGETTFYHYDDFNRLEHIKDKDGNMLSKTEYNFKN